MSHDGSLVVVEGTWEPEKPPASRRTRRTRWGWWRGAGSQRAMVLVGGGGGGGNSPKLPSMYCRERNLDIQGITLFARSAHWW